MPFGDLLGGRTTVCRRPASAHREAITRGSQVREDPTPIRLLTGMRKCISKTTALIGGVSAALVRSLVVVRTPTQRENVTSYEDRRRRRALRLCVGARPTREHRGSLLCNHSFTGPAIGVGFRLSCGAAPKNAGCGTGGHDAVATSKPLWHMLQTFTADASIARGACYFAWGCFRYFVSQAACGARVANRPTSPAD